MKREFFIAGVQFRPRVEINKAMNEMKVGNHLSLEAEPTNKFDPNAVKIIASLTATEEHGSESPEVFLGYVPKTFSAEVAGLLESGFDLECIVQEVNPLSKPWEMCKVVIQDVKEIPEVVDEFGTDEEKRNYYDEEGEE